MHLLIEQQATHTLILRTSVLRINCCSGSNIILQCFTFFLIESFAGDIGFIVLSNKSECFVSHKIIECILFLCDGFKVSCSMPHSAMSFFSRYAYCDFVVESTYSFSA